MMKIAIFDIDDTITYESDFLRKYAPKFLEKENLKAIVVDERGYYLEEIYGLRNQFMDRGCSLGEAELEANKLADKFWRQHFIKYNFCPVRPGVCDLIEELKKNGYQIHMLSLRGKKTMKKVSAIDGDMQFEMVSKITKLMLKMNHIYYDRLRLVSDFKEKLDYIKYYFPEIVFEDQISIIKNIDRRIARVCISNIHNLDEDLPEGVTRLNSYTDCLSIKKNITPVKNDRVGKNLKIRMVDFLQYTAKKIGKLYFWTKFHPIVFGIDNIPLKGSMIFVGNHRDNLDPIFISITSKRTIHWAALLRLFQGKEDVFSAKSGSIRKKFFSKFICLMGALPIARPTDNNYVDINSKTISDLTLLLRMGASVGFFPEGTINREPLKNDILPLKSNRVFRMAVETDSYVQPFSIVWIPSEAGIRNKLIIVYSMPINVHNRDKKEVRDLWQEAEICNINRSNKLIEELLRTKEDLTYS